MNKGTPSKPLTIEQALARAKKASRKGDIVAALQLYNAILQQQPNHPLAKKRLRKLQKDLPLDQAAQKKPANPSQEEFNSLVSLHRSGQLLNLEQACKELLQSYPQSLFVINALGVALQEQGKLQEAISTYDKLLQLKPDYAEAYSNRGNALKNLGQLQEAVESYDKAIQLKPDFAKAYSNRGNALTEMDQLQEAVASYDKAIQIEPDYAEAYYNRGNTLIELGQLQEAVASHDQAIQLKPDHAEAYYNRGNTLIALGQLQEAVASHDKAIQIKPDHAQAYSNRGHALKELGQLDEALASYDKAIQIKPDYAEAFSNRGGTLKELGQLVEAVSSYGKAIQINPAYAEAYYNLGNTLAVQGQLKEALASYDSAIQNKPDYTEAYSNRGNILIELGQFDEALASYDRAIQVTPGSAEAYSNRGNALKDLGHLKEAMASYDRAIQIKPQYAEAYSNLLTTQNYAVTFTAADRLAMARKFGEIATAKAQTRFSTDRSPPMTDRLRVGFVSGDLRKHPVGYFLESILCSIDSSKLELFAYPTNARVDALSERIKPFFSSWKSISGQRDEDAARLIHADGVHVLLDLAGHTADNRLPVFAYKPAPVQVSWLGYFATTGMNEMDYVLGDPYVSPQKIDEQFIEKVWRLPETRWCFTAPDADIKVSPPPALDRDYVTFGCFNNLSKINDKVLELWARVLDSIPDSRLLLKARQLHEQSVREGEIKRLSAHGIDNARIILEGPETRQEYFSAYNRIDITLDPFPFTGGTTSVESLWMGVPVLTLAGDSLVSRQGVGVLMNAGLPDWIAEDEEEYLAKAVLFASDLDKLAGLRAGLRAQVLSSPLFDAPRFARNFEDALLEMWNQHIHQP